jgi:hypothetical protein
MMVLALPRALLAALACLLLAPQLGCAVVASKIFGTRTTSSHSVRPTEPEARLRCDGAPCASASFTAESTRPYNPYVLYGTAVAEGVAGGLMYGLSGDIIEGKNAFWATGGILLILAAVGEAGLGAFGMLEFDQKTECCAFDQQTTAALRGDRLLLTSIDVAAAVLQNDLPKPDFSFAEALARRKAKPKAYPTPPPDPSEAVGRLKAGSKVAVLEFKSGARELRKEDVRFYSDVVRGAALKLQPRLDVITRENLLVLLQSAGKNASDCEGTCQVDTGRRIGADAVVSGELGHVGKLYKLSLLLHDTASGNLLGSLVASGGTLAELEASVAQTSLELLTRQ